MKSSKRGLVLFVLFSIILLTLIFSYVQIVLAEQSEQDVVPQAYNWLINQTKKWDSLGTNESAFSLLALQCNDTFMAKGNKSLYNQSFFNSTQQFRCWKLSGKPQNSRDCKIFDTALADLALSEIDENTTTADNWLLSNKKVFSGNIYWYLQIDVPRNKEVSCEIMYQDSLQNVTIYGNKTVKIMNGGGDCIEQVYKDYWFKIKKSDDCYSNTYSMKCFGNESDSGTATSVLLYNNDSTTNKIMFSVSSEIAQGTIGYVDQLGEEIQQPGVMELSTPSYCLGPADQAGVCDYEGTAWAAFVWQKEGKQDYANMFIPYLVVYSGYSNNQKYFTESFLSKLVGGDFSTQLIKDQQRIRKPQSTEYWSFWLNQPMLYGQFYDTPKAVLSLGDSSPNMQEVRNYLLNKISSEYSWKNTFDSAPSKDTLRDTAFILWVFWPNYCPGAGGTQGSECEQQGIGFACQDSCDPLNQNDWSTLYNCPSGMTCCQNKTINADECVSQGGICQNGTCDSGSGQLVNVLCPLEKPLCCKEYSGSYCSDFNRSICEYNGEYCQDNQTAETIDGSCCLSACVQNNSGTQSCYNLGGSQCASDETCWNYDLGVRGGFTPALDGPRCCVFPLACVRDQDCSDIGKDCSSASYGTGYRCVNGQNSGEIVKTKDVEECCLNDCKKSCSTDNLCTASQQCSGNAWDTSSIDERCCMNKCTTKSSGSIWWILIIIFIVIIAALVLYFLVFKKKNKEGEEEQGDEFGKGDFPFSGPVMPRSEKQNQKLDQDQGFEKKFELPAFKPFNPKQNKTAAPSPAKSAPFRFPVQTQVKKKPESVVTRTKTITKTTTTGPKRSGFKTKAEDELEETLGKLKKISKK